MVKREIFRFKKGKITSLDQIYIIQGLGGGDWWEKTGNDVDDKKDIDLGEEVVITRNIEIEIIIRQDK